MNKKLVYLLVITLLAGMLVLELSSARQKSQTNDEAVHLLAGYSYLTEYDYRLNAEHPPLTKYLAALPLLFLQPELNKSNLGWQNTNQWNMAPEFLYHNTVSPDKLLLWGRIPTMLLSILLGYLIFHWTKKLFGERAGLIALIFYVFSPNILAHSRLITSDLAITLFFLATFYFLYRYLQNPKTKNLIIFCLVFGLTMLTKFSAPTIIPIIILLLFIKWFHNPEGFPLRKIMLTIFSMLAIGLFIIWAGYGFETLSMQDDPFFQFRLGKTAKYLPFFSVPIPAYHYWVGLLKVFTHSLYGQDTYLLGQYSLTGWWYYFPVAFLVKTPLSVIFLAGSLLFGSFGKIRKGFRKIPFKYFILSIPPLFYFLTTLVSNLNLGLRHLLPIYPFIFIGIGSLVNWPILRNKIAASVFIVITGFYLFSTSQIFPDHLAYFNEAVGGPKNGPKYLLDSNIDWGQDIKPLSNYLVKNNINKIYFNDPGSAPARYYLPQAEPIPSEQETVSGYLAVTVNSLYSENSPYAWLKKYQPMERIGYSIYLYKF